MTDMEYLEAHPVSVDILGWLANNPGGEQQLVSLTHREQAAKHVLVGRELIDFRTVWPHRGAVRTYYRITAKGWLLLQRLQNKEAT
jgi:hypothetical protein